MDFGSTITALWDRLGLGRPHFAEAGRVRLIVESTGIDLADDDRGGLVVEAVAGSLDAGDDEARHRQIRRVLETNLGLLRDGEAGIHIRDLPGKNRALVACASYRYAPADIGRLVRKIEDVVAAVEYYRAELAANPAPAAAWHDAAAAETSTLIFRP